MRIVLVGPPEVSDWLLVEKVMNSVGRDDTLIHSGSWSLGGKVDRIAKRTTRGNRPAVVPQLPEIPKYAPEVAFEKNAAQMLMHHRAEVVIQFGDEVAGEMGPVLELAEKLHLTIITAEDFVRERRQHWV